MDIAYDFLLLPPGTSIVKMNKAIFLIVCIAGCSAFLKAQDSTILDRDSILVQTLESPMEAPPIIATKWNQIHTRFFTMNIGLAFIVDHNIVGQDQTNISQVGKINDEAEIRAERFILTGTLLFFKYPWRYMISANYNGLDRPDGSKRFAFMDWNVEIPFGKRGGWLTFGKQKEGVSHEYVSAGSQMMFMERGSGAPAFVRQRNIGIRYSNSVLDNRVTYTVGYFNNYWETNKSFSENGSQAAFRLTALPVYKSDRQFTHLGLGLRSTQATNEKLAYKAKPEVNTAPSFLNTDSFLAKSGSTIMFELIKVKGPVSIIAEGMRTVINSKDVGNPSFYYWQVGGSWFITGENRRYNRQVGCLGKLIPRKKLNFHKGGGPGAIELGTRYTQTNLSDSKVQGGKFGRLTTALSWYPNQYFRFEINYGHGILEKQNLTGKNNIWQFRAQFEL